MGSRAISLLSGTHVGNLTWLGQVDVASQMVPDIGFATWFGLSITSTGSVAYCCMDGDGEYPIGDVNFFDLSSPGFGSFSSSRRSPGGAEVLSGFLRPCQVMTISHWERPRPFVIRFRVSRSSSRALIPGDEAEEMYPACSELDLIPYRFFQEPCWLPGSLCALDESGG